MRAALFPTPGFAQSTTLWRISKMALAVIVATAALLFLGRALHASWAELARLVIDSGFMLWAAALSLPYAACLFILAVSWYLPLHYSAPGGASVRSGAYVYCVANIAKYLPGNVFHFAGRQVLGAKAGWKHRAIAQATILEIGAIIASILLIALVVIGLGPADIVHGLMPYDWNAMVAPYRRLAALTTLAVGGLLFFLLAHLRLFGQLLDVPTASAVRAIVLCTIFFCLYATLVMLFASLLAIPTNASPLYTIGLAYLLAWLAGFVVPGAPGGLGVRESVLVLILAEPGGVGEAAALSLGLGMRLITTLGDAIAAAAAAFIIRGQERTTPRPGRQSQ